MVLQNKLNDLKYAISITQRENKKMKSPEKQIYTITKTRWLCGIEGHNHETEEVAQRCINNQNKIKNGKFSKSNANIERAIRNIGIAKSFINGSTVKSIMIDFDVTRDTAQRAVRSVISAGVRNSCLRGVDVSFYYGESLDKLRKTHKNEMLEVIGCAEDIYRKMGKIK